MQAHLWVVLEHDDEVLADEEKVHVGGEEGVGKALWARSAGPPLLHRSTSGLVEAGIQPGRPFGHAPAAPPSQGCNIHPQHIELRNACLLAWPSYSYMMERRGNLVGFFDLLH